MGLIERIESIARNKAVLIDVEWGRRVIYYIDCSKGSWINHIAVVFVYARRGEPFTAAIERSMDEFMAWLGANRQLYDNAIAAQQGESEPLHALRAAHATYK